MTPSIPSKGVGGRADHPSKKEIILPASAVQGTRLIIFDELKIA